MYKILIHIEVQIHDTSYRILMYTIQQQQQWKNISLCMYKSPISTQNYSHIRKSRFTQTKRISYIKRNQFTLKFSLHFVHVFINVYVMSKPASVLTVAGDLADALVAQSSIIHNTKTWDW